MAEQQTSDHLYNAFCNSIPEDIKSIVTTKGVKSRDDTEKKRVIAFKYTLSRDQIKLYKQFEKEWGDKRLSVTRAQYEKNGRGRLEKERKRVLQSAPQAILEILNALIESYNDYLSLSLKDSNGEDNDDDDDDGKATTIEDALSKIEDIEKKLRKEILSTSCKELINTQWPTVKTKKVILINRFIYAKL